MRGHESGSRHRGKRQRPGARAAVTVLAGCSSDPSIMASQKEEPL